jgi:hypothetical protein
VSETESRRFYIATDATCVTWWLVAPSLLDVCEHLRACDVEDPAALSIREVEASEALSIKLTGADGLPTSLGDAEMGALFCSEGP